MNNDLRIASESPSETGQSEIDEDDDDEVMLLNDLNRQTFPLCNIK